MQCSGTYVPFIASRCTLSTRIIYLSSKIICQQKQSTLSCIQSKLSLIIRWPYTYTPNDVWEICLMSSYFLLLANKIICFDKFNRIFVQLVNLFRSLKLNVILKKNHKTSCRLKPLFYQLIRYQDMVVILLDDKGFLVFLRSVFNDPKQSDESQSYERMCIMFLRHQQYNREISVIVDVSSTPNNMTQSYLKQCVKNKSKTPRHLSCQPNHDDVRPNLSQIFVLYTNHRLDAIIQAMSCVVDRTILWYTFIQSPELYDDTLLPHYDHCVAPGLQTALFCQSIAIMAVYPIEYDEDVEMSSCSSSPSIHYCLTSYHGTSNDTDYPTYKTFLSNRAPVTTTTVHPTPAKKNASTKPNLQMEDGGGRNQFSRQFVDSKKNGFKQRDSNNTISTPMKSKNLVNSTSSSQRVPNKQSPTTRSIFQAGIWKIWKPNHALRRSRDDILETKKTDRSISSTLSHDNSKTILDKNNKSVKRDKKITSRFFRGTILPRSSHSISHQHSAVSQSQGHFNSSKKNDPNPSVSQINSIITQVDSQHDHAVYKKSNYYGCARFSGLMSTKDQTVHDTSTAVGSRKSVAPKPSSRGLSILTLPLSRLNKKHQSYLGPQPKEFIGRHTLVLDLDETLVHSSFVEIPNYSFSIPVEIDHCIYSIYVLKRPGVDLFLQSVAKYYEIVIFTASLAKYADPLMDILDPNNYCSCRLFRESCVFSNGQYVKDLSQIGRDLRKIIIVDNSPASYAFQPDNAIPIETWIDDPTDTELYQLIPLLEALRHVDDIPSVLWKTLNCAD